jgi:hypothetical protein
MRSVPHISVESCSLARLEGHTVCRGCVHEWMDQRHGAREQVPDDEPLFLACVLCERPQVYEFLMHRPSLEHATYMRRSETLYINSVHTS